MKKVQIKSRFLRNFQRNLESSLAVQFEKQLKWDWYLLHCKPRQIQYGNLIVGFFFIFKNATEWVLSLDRDSIYSYQISYKSPLTVLPFENLYFTESNSYTQLIDCQNFTLKISFAMSTRVCKEHCYRKKAASVGQNCRLSTSCNFFNFFLTYKTMRYHKLNLRPCGTHWWI